MTSRSLVVASLLALLLSTGCALKRPPAPPPIECEELDRAEERFPEQCGTPDEADGQADGEPDGEEGESDEQPSGPAATP